MTNKAGTTKSPKKPRIKKLDAHVTHLEMTSMSVRHLPVPTKPAIALMRAENIPVKFYRYLYELVGKPHHWEERRTISDSKLNDIINAGTTEISVLYADGCPAGFFEISTVDLPHSTEIIYFGIGPDHQGLGVGKWFLSAAISAAWLHKPSKITVHTNTLDHPSALPLYQKFGFSPVAVSDEKVLPWE